MRAILTIAVAVAACRSGGPRESECAQVRTAAAGAPRRYLGAVVADKLAAITFRDPEVQAAVRAGDVAKLESVCGPLRGAVDARAQDCALVMMWVPSADQEVHGTAIIDPSVGSASFRDPQIRAAMKELGESGWMPGGSARATPDPRLAKIRALCGYPPRGR